MNDQGGATVDVERGKGVWLDFQKRVRGRGTPGQKQLTIRSGIFDNGQKQKNPRNEHDEKVNNDREKIKQKRWRTAVKRGPLKVQGQGWGPS